MKRQIRLVLCLLAAFVTAIPLYASEGSLLQAAARKRRNNNNQTPKQRAKQKAAAAKRKLAKKIANAKKNANKNRPKGTVPAKPNPRTNTKKKPDTKTTGEPAKVSVYIRDWKETQKLIGDQKGKIVVVDVWATSCEPCIKELPGLVALQEKHSKDVVTITFNVDNSGSADSAPDKIQPKIVEQLTKLKAFDVRNFLSKDRDEAVYKQMRIDAPPTILVYGRDGKLARKFDVNSTGGKDVTYTKHVTPFVEELLKTK